MKKLCTVLLAIVMLAGLAACGTPASSDVSGASGGASQDATAEDGVTYELNDLGLPVASEPITLTVMGSKHPIQGEWKDMSLWKWLSEQTNITFAFNTPPAEGYGEKKNLALASNELPDLFLGADLTTSDELNYGMKQQALLPLDTLLDEAPNMAKMFEEHPDWMKALRMPDEHFYTLPQDFVGFGLYRYSWINQAWLDKLDLEMPQTVDALYEVLKAFKTGDPNGNGQNDEIPLSFTSELYDQTRSTILSAFGYLSASYEIVDGKVVFSPITDGYKAYVKYMRKLWAEGLIDPDAFAQTHQQQVAKGAAGQLGMFSYIADYVTVGIDIHEQYKVLPPLTSDVSGTKMAYGVFPMASGTAAITKANPYPEITMSLLDWFYTETGALCLINGVEGVDWERTADGGMTFHVPEGANKEEYRGGVVTSDCGTMLPRYTEPAEAVIIGGDYAGNAPLEANIHFQVMDTIAPHSHVAMPKLVFTEDEQKTVLAKSTDISTYIVQTEAQFIVGDKDIDAGWDDYVATLKAMGVDELQKIYEDAYARFNS